MQILGNPINPAHEHQYFIMFFTGFMKKVSLAPRQIENTSNLIVCLLWTIQNTTVLMHVFH